MRVRHHIPSIFSLSMVDVLCCAMGCIILLWLLKAKEQEDSAEEQQRVNTALLDEARAEKEEKEKVAALLKAANVDRAGVYGVLRDLQGKMSTLEGEKAALEKRLAAQLEEARERERKLKASAARVAELAGQLDDADKRMKGLGATAQQVPGLRKDLEAARVRYADEEARARALEREIARRRDELKEAGTTLEGLRAARRALERDLEGRDKELALARPYKDKWSGAEARVTSLGRQLAERDRALAAAGRSIETLEEDKKALRAEAARVRAAADNRFAGVALTGRRVVFLVDTSGSMDLVAEDTPAPAKWPEVRDTVVKVMRSLPDLEKFQVIGFAEKTTYLLGGRGDWLDYDARTSPERVLKALKAVKPDGGTDMYLAVEAAFRLRAQGLDTVYLFSDGLPNVGEGLPPGGGRGLTEVQRSELLAKHIRKTLKADWNRPQRARPRVRINAVGFFYESPDVGAFLWALARENDGSFVGMSKP
jgi:hypothetical protein